MKLNRVMKKKPNQTTKKDFELFRAECEKWIDKFGLRDWRVYFEHDGKRDWLDGAYAGLSADSIARSATIVLNTDWHNVPVTNRQLKRSALHEVCELLLFPMKTIAETRYIGHEEVAEQIHVVIRRLENLLIGPTE